MHCLPHPNSALTGSTWARLCHQGNSHLCTCPNTHQWNRHSENVSLLPPLLLSCWLISCLDFYTASIIKVFKVLCMEHWVDNKGAALDKSCDGASVLITLEFEHFGPIFPLWGILSLGGTDHSFLSAHNPVLDTFSYKTIVYLQRYACCSAQNLKPQPKEVQIPTSWVLGIDLDLLFPWA